MLFMERTKTIQLHLNLLVLMMLSFILRMGLPQLKFLFIPLFLYFTVYVLYEMFTHKTIPGIKHFLFFNGIYLLLLGIYLSALIYKTGFLLPVKEFISGTILLILFYYIYFYLTSFNIPFYRFKKVFVQHLIVITFIVAVTGLVKLNFSVFGRSFPFSPELAKNALTSSVTADYNFFSLTLIFGILTMLYQLYVREKISSRALIAYHLVMGLFSFIILTSQSRRSFMVLLVILTLIFLGRMIVWIYSELKFAKFFKRNDGYLVLMAFLCFMGYALMFFTSDQLKTQVVEDSRIYKSDFRIELTNAVNRYATVLGIGFQQKDLYEILWNQDARPQGAFRKKIKQWIDKEFLDSTHTSHTCYHSDYNKATASGGDYQDLPEHHWENSVRKGAPGKFFIISELDFFLSNNEKDSVTVSSSENLHYGIAAQVTDTNDSGEKVGRKGRWKYAFLLFSGYSLSGKLFGNGFSYLSRFGEKFNGSSHTYEYPHNPLISALLYSGIVGAGIYVFFLVYTFVLYIRNFHALQYFFLLFLITASYIFISGNSHFSVPAFVFLSLFPWFYTSLNTKMEV